MNSFTATLLIFTVVLILLPSETYAFGAGDIPDFAYLNGKAFRHGDIENILAELAKTVGHAGGGGGGLLDFAQSVLSAAASGGNGSKFTKEDVKRVYFGNWLRDYSQAMDIAGLSKLSADTLVLIVSVLGFLTFGFATEEFQVTPDRLGVYLPVEHIDNPKGYAEKEGDARQFHPKLRPPVNPEELEIDERTGMKANPFLPITSSARVDLSDSQQNYMASENRGWDTSTALIRRVFRACIEYGRRARGREGDDLWEAYRLMGTGLHTMEDLLAHSNWCELGLRKLGYNDVFCHVGDNVVINTPTGETHPLITGTFGSADFLHSLMGEATDHLSQASVVDLTKKMDEASQDNNTFGALQALLRKLPIGGSDADDKMGEANTLQAQAKAYRFDPNNVAPPEVREQLWNLLTWRDNVYRGIIKKIEMVPGLSDLIDNLTNALNAFVYTVLAPYVAPILKQVTEVLMEGSKAVIDTEDQYLVFDDPNASDPSHSLLSKDHFALILNEPAGKIAKVVVQNSVKLLVQAWFDNSDPDRVIDEVLEAFHHPWYATGRSRIQEEMFQTLQNWVNNLENAEETIQALSKESVRAGKNKRQGADDDITSSTQIYGGHVNQASGGSGYGAPVSAGYGASQVYGGTQDHYRQETYGGSQEYGRQEPVTESQRYGDSQGESYSRTESRGYGNSGEAYGSTGNYGSGYGGYGDSEVHGRRQEESGYGGYGNRREEEPSYGRETGYGSGGYQQSYGRREDQGYGKESYGGGYRQQEGEREVDLERERKREQKREQERERAQQSYGGGYGERESGSGYDEERREEYGGYRPSAYEAPLEDSRRERREERSDYSGERYGQEGYVPDYGGGYGSSERSEYGGLGGYGGRQEGGYGEAGEAFGVENLSLREGGHHHGHHKHHRRHDDD
ncbi:Het-C-domain-containing protein [Dichomitus squalens]|uniref:Het-C-domain-containing protein n=1 Tax=Dichomitus squalens TaxID=114155 RepID=A0A4Q9Q4H6_9APHY|nr:Het-C-domain-containing protein [Dichomitus squalens]